MHVLDRLRTFAAKELSLDADALEPETPLGSLHIDSLAFMDFIFKVEAEFDIRMPDEQVTNMRTIGDLVRSVSERLPAASES